MSQMLFIYLIFSPTRRVELRLFSGSAVKIDRENIIGQEYDGSLAGAMMSSIDSKREFSDQLPFLMQSTALWYPAYTLRNQQSDSASSLARSVFSGGNGVLLACAWAMAINIVAASPMMPRTSATRASDVIARGGPDVDGEQGGADGVILLRGSEIVDVAIVVRADADVA